MCNWHCGQVKVKAIYVSLAVNGLKCLIYTSLYLFEQIIHVIISSEWHLILLIPIFIIILDLWISYIVLNWTMIVSICSIYITLSYASGTNDTNLDSIHHDSHPRAVTKLISVFHWRHIALILCIVIIWVTKDYVQPTIQQLLAKLWFLPIILFR